MRFTLVANTVYTVKWLIESKWYFLDRLDVDWTCLIKINHLSNTVAPWNLITSKVYIAWSGVKNGEQWYNYVINDTESDFIDYDKSREWATAVKRLDSVRLSACCDDTEIKITIL